MIPHFFIPISNDSNYNERLVRCSVYAAALTETDREGEKEVTQMPPLLTQEIIAKWNTLNDTYRTINCTDDNDCPKNCTCFRHGMKSYYCAHVYREEGGI
ncbi:hypothetical protein MTO96_017815 [Rhipicephalus appendiculatus]